MNPRPKTLILLIFLLFLLGLGGLGGGIAMLIDPSGETLGLPPESLDGLPISTFIYPGLFLVIVMGIVPLVIVWRLWNGLRWGWTAALVQSILLILWIVFQILLWGEPIPIQMLYLIWGVFMLGLCFVPSVRSSQDKSSMGDSNDR